jgi:F0F1-type ATP synthase assembly protein I
VTAAHGESEPQDRSSDVDRRALNRGFGDAMARAFELAVTPTIFGFFGWLLDRWLGTAPFLMLGLGLFTAVYVGWRMLQGYDVAMQEHEARLSGARRTGVQPPKEVGS